MVKHGVLKKIFRPEEEEVRGGWKKVHSGSRHNLFNIISPVTENTSI